MIAPGLYLHSVITYYWCAKSNIHNEHSKTFFLKDSDLVPLLVSDVFVDGEDEHEHEEDANAAKDVPDVVPVINSW